LGVIFLMFHLGLEFSFRKLARLGTRVTFTGLMEVSLLVVTGFVGAKCLGWTSAQSLFLGAAISISSTTIILKALSELGLNKRHFAETIFGILVVEDLLAVLLLVLLSSFVTSRHGVGVGDLVLVLVKLVLVTGSWFLVGYFLIPRLVKSIGRVGNEELLTIAAVGLCFVLVSVGASFGYSPALGAFIMGSILAETREVSRIEPLMRPLRDLFAAVFFVSIGMLVDLKEFAAHSGAIVALSLLVIVGKLGALTLSGLAAGQTLPQALRVGLSMAQIGEFSLIIATLGAASKEVPSYFYPVVVATSIVTTFTTPYLTRLAGHVSTRLERGRSPQGAHGLEHYLRRWSPELDPRPALFARVFLSWLCCGIVVTFLFHVVDLVLFRARGVTAFLEARLSHAGLWVLACFAALFLASPFVWAMFTLFRKRGRGLFPSWTFLLFRLLTVAWLLLLLAPWLKTPWSWAVVAGSSLIVYLLSYSRLERGYDWFESQFLATFEDLEESSSRESKTIERVRKFLPWDAHLMRFKVHANARASGLTLSESKLRELHGFNIVAIRRGEQVVVSPEPGERILPFDEVLGIGTDAALENAREALELVDTHVGPTSAWLEAYELRKLKVGEESRLKGRSILDSGIRENYGGLVVGVERRGRRILNPPPHFAFARGDRVWVVGDSARLKDLQRGEKLDRA
jgi:CPA2 family monovalent cation:H+ antiporter-2